MPCGVEKPNVAASGGKLCDARLRRNGIKRLGPQAADVDQGNHGGIVARTAAPVKGVKTQKIKTNHALSMHFLGHFGLEKRMDSAWSKTDFAAFFAVLRFRPA
jgi:hypothetical protein